MRRRDFITLFGGAAIAWPFAVRAQQAATPIVGFVAGRSTEASARPVAAFRKGLNERSYVEDQNVMVEYHLLGDQYDRVPRPRRKRPCGGRAAEKANELTSPQFRTQAQGPALYRLKRVL
jgi:hypothetical protein